MSALPAIDTDPLLQPLAGSVPPARCDVLVVGAGPAGSACAQMLARAGLDTVLADQHDFPRDKVCGDGLIPDAHAALRRLGVYDEVAALWQRSGHVACIGPRGGRVDVPGQVAVLPRRALDHIVCRAAVDAGARLATPWRFDMPLEEGGRVVGARLAQGARRAEVAAHWVVLATGAAAPPLMAAGLCDRRTPSAMALRGYLRHPGALSVGAGEAATTLRALQVVWHRRLRSGYGWVFPAPGGLFNVGVGVSSSHRPGRVGRAAMRDINLREAFETFTQVYPPLRDLVSEGTWAGPLKGAPLRCSLAGARWSRPGLLAAGEAAGSTYAFTGEGIGKAMETGLHAAEVLSAAARRGRLAPGADDDADTEQAYAAGLAALKPRFDLYERANFVNEHSWLADLLIWRARRAPHLVRRMAGVLDETANPGKLVTARGLMRLFTPARG